MSFNLNEFFYNIVPGTLFLIFWYLKIESIKKLFIDISNLNNNSFIFGVIALIIALALGLVLHGVWRTIKFFLISNSRVEREEEYNANAYLWAEDKRKLPEYFSARSAVWCSLIVGLVVSLFIVEEYWLYYIVLIFVFGFMYYADFKKEKNAIERTYSEINSYKKDVRSENELFNEAKAVVIKFGEGSASILQRRLNIGYARAARLLDLLEAEGVIGPSYGAKPRKVLIKK